MAEPFDFSTSRAEAEMQWKLRSPPAPPANDPVRLVHELQVHQIELELQNAALVEANHELELIRSRFHSMYESAPVGYVTLDLDGCVVDCNAQAVTMLMRPLGRILKTRVSPYFHPDSIPGFERLIDEAMRVGDASSDELLLLRPHGMPIYIHGQARRLVLPDNTPEIVLLVLIDITTLKAARDDITSMLGGSLD